MIVTLLADLPSPVSPIELRSNANVLLAEIDLGERAPCDVAHDLFIAVVLTAQHGFSVRLHPHPRKGECAELLKRKRGSFACNVPGAVAQGTN